MSLLYFQPESQRLCGAKALPIIVSLLATILIASAACAHAAVAPRHPLAAPLSAEIFTAASTSSISNRADFDDNPLPPAPRPTRQTNRSHQSAR